MNATDTTLTTTDVVTPGTPMMMDLPRVASTLVEGSRLAGVGLLVEIKCTARVVT